MSATRRRVLMGLSILLLTTLATLVGTAQGGGDPRDLSEDFYDAIDGARCMLHHDFQGMRPMIVSLAARYPQLAIGETTDLVVNVRNPWRHDLSDIQVTLNTTQAPNILVMTDDRPEAQVVVGNRTRLDLSDATVPGYRENITVLENATTVMAYVRVVDATLGAALGPVTEQEPVVQLALEGPSDIAMPQPGRGDKGAKAVRVDGEAIAKQGFGAWRLSLWYEEGLDDQVEVEYGFAVFYNASAASEHTFYAQGVALREGESVSITIPIQATSEESAFLDLRVQGRTSFTHQPGSNAVDTGHFWRFITMNTKGGDAAIALQGAAAPQITGFQVDVLNLLTRILGFVSAFLIPVSMVTGGLFGKASRRSMNRLLGGARRRVLWHSSMSWAILVVATMHLVLALVEAQFVWTKGLLWGGVGWVLLLSLGVTGYWQVRMIKRWDYRLWRNVHLWSAVGVFVFAGLHTVIDGSDLGPLRTWWPFLQRLAWP